MTALGRLLVLVVLVHVVGCASISSSGDGSDPMFGLGDREQFTLVPSSLDREFHILVRLPRSYAESEREYPMVLLLDGGILFPMLSPYQLMMEVQGSADEVIVVGISYGGLGFSNGNFRGTDYTAPSPEVEYFGGAAAFADFLAAELLPRLEREYRIDRDRTLLLGQSLGGQFAMFAALTRPGLFSSFVAVNPAIHANLAYFLDLQAAPADPPARLVMAMGSEDDPRYRDAALAWIDARRGQADPGLGLVVIDFPGAHHATSAPAAYFEVVREAFPPPDP